MKTPLTCNDEIYVVPEIRIACREIVHGSEFLNYIRVTIGPRQRAVPNTVIENRSVYFLYSKVVDQPDK